MVKFDERTIIVVTKSWLYRRHSKEMTKCRICNKDLIEGDKIRLMGSKGRPRVIHSHHERY